MTKKGSELIFISRINRDGKGITDMSEEDTSFLNNEKFETRLLSITNKTYIANGFNSYVVQLKHPL